MSATVPVPRVAPQRPVPAYEPSPASTSPSIQADESLLLAVQTASRRLVSSQTVPIRSARAFSVRAGQVFRLTTLAGAQVGDLNVWAAANPRERFWAARTRQLHAAHVSVGDRLWSCLPYLRPLATITADSLAGGAWGVYHNKPPEDDNGDDEGDDNGKDGTTATTPTTTPTSGQGIYGCHDLLGTRCDPYANTLLGGGDFDFQCHSNLTRAVREHGLEERDVHDVLNVFQVTGLDERGRYWMGTSPARAGDYLEFFAEVDLLCALSACPGGDLSRFGWTGSDHEAESQSRSGSSEAAGQRQAQEGAPADPMLATCKPLGIEIYDLEQRDAVLARAGWTPPRSPPYRGLHGMKMPVFGGDT